MNIFFILAMSNDLERIFLGGYYMISWERIKIGIDSFERIECLKN